MFTTGGTFNNNQLTFYTNGGVAYSVPIHHFTSITVSDFFTANTVNSNSLNSKILYSASTNLYDIFELKGTEDITRVQNGLNTYTGGTPNSPSVNISSVTLNNLTASGNTIVSSFSATTIFSGNTNLYNIFQTIGSDLNKTYVQQGSNITTGGTVDYPTINLVNSPSVAGLSTSAATIIKSTLTVTGNTSLANISATTIFSGSTNLSNLFATQITATNLQNQINTKVNLSGATFTGNVYATYISATTLNAGIINSGNTNLYNIFAPIESIVSIRPGLNTYTAGTQINPSVNISSATLNTLTVSGNSSVQSMSANQITVGTKILTTNNIILSGDILNGRTW